MDLASSPFLDIVCGIFWSVFRARESLDGAVAHRDGNLCAMVVVAMKDFVR